MELKKIKEILQRYFEGKSTEQEEQLLYDYFKANSIAPELEKYRYFFTGIDTLSSMQRDEMLEEEIMDHILENEHKEKTHYRWLWQTVSGIAAALVIALLAMNFFGTNRQWKDTYSNPDEAYAEASKTLQYVAGYYQKGISALEPVKVINTASKPLDKSLNTLEKGFQEIQHLEKMNEKLRK